MKGILFLFFFFFKQKTAYEIYQCDWSSDVCSSDLPYAGAIGYLSYNGELDTCICIRTILVKDGMAYVQAGGGVVADSVPANEYEETCNKARAMFAAIELAQAQEDWQ